MLSPRPTPHGFPCFTITAAGPSSSRARRRAAERSPLELLDPSEEMRPRALLRVVGAPLVRVLAVREVHVALEDGNEDLRERIVAAQPARDRGVEGGGALEGARGQPAPGGVRDLAAHPELLDDGLVVLG